MPDTTPVPPNVVNALAYSGNLANAGNVAIPFIIATLGATDPTILPPP